MRQGIYYSGSVAVLCMKPVLLPPYWIDGFDYIDGIGDDI